MIRWVTPFLGTAPASKVELEHDMRLLDVRDLVDKFGNHPDAIYDKIETGLKFLKEGRRVVVGCDYGISRSNSVAAGLLSVFKNISFDDAAYQVVQSTGELEIKLGPLNAVRSALLDKKEAAVLNIIQKDRLRVLLTGGTGFIGQCFSSEYADEYSLHAPSSDEINLLSGATLLDLYAKKNQVSFCVHLANPRVYTSNKAMGDAVTMLRNVLEVCVSNNLHLIFPSTHEIYLGCVLAEGQKDCVLHVDENTTPCPKGPYGETKYLCENLINHYRKKHGLKATILRSSLLYGPSSDRPRFLYNFIAKALKNEDIYTHQYQNAKPMLDILHVTDFTSAIHCALQSSVCHDVNLGGNSIWSTQDIAGYVCEALGSQSKIKPRLVEDNIVNIAFQNISVNQKIGWKQNMEFKQGINDLLNIQGVKSESKDKCND